MSTSVCWDLTCDGLVSHPGEVEDSRPLNTTETGDMRCKEFSFTIQRDHQSQILYEPSGPWSGRLSPVSVVLSR